MPERVGSGIPESWDIKSVDEIMTDTRGGFNVVGRREQSIGGSMASTNKLSKSAFVGRIWRSHPRYSDEADSSLRGLLDLCAELLLLNRTFRATARSRLNIRMTQIAKQTQDLLQKKQRMSLKSN
jgi:hypothetical protein